MNTIAFIAAGVLLALVILAKIPGLEHTVRPLIDLVFTALKAILENMVFWSIWLFKLLWDAHLELLKHLMLSAESIDPTVAFTAKPGKPGKSVWALLGDSQAYAKIKAAFKRS